MSKAIIVVSFGTTYPETRKKTIQACEEAIQKRFPDFQVHRAFTSNVVIKRIKENEGISVPTVNQLLEQLKKDGVISGGMIPKVDCLVTAVQGSVQRAVIIDGRVPHSILIEMFSEEGIGTLVEE